MPLHRERTVAVAPVFLQVRFLFQVEAPLVAFSCCLRQLVVSNASASCLLDRTRACPSALLIHSFNDVRKISESELNSFRSTQMFSSLAVNGAKKSR